jgi:predicted DNA-binding protein (MmcQ/YjbR family)
MNNERVRNLVMSWPHVRETLNWDCVFVYWAADRAIGGKMFALTDANGTGENVLILPVDPERFYELIEHEDIEPASHMGKHNWIDLRRWDALPWAETEQLLRAAYERKLAGLPPKTHAILSLPVREQNRIIREQTKILAEKTAQAKAAKVAKREAAKAARTCSKAKSAKTTAKKPTKKLTRRPS